MASLANCLSKLETSPILISRISTAWRTLQYRNKRRTLTPPAWVPPKDESVHEIYDESTKSLYRELIEMEKQGVGRNLPGDGLLPFVDGPSTENNGEARVWKPESKRIGLLARKIGMLPQWLADGTRVLCTLLEFPDNHIISAVDPDTWYRNSKVGKRKAFNRFGEFWKVTIGAVNADPSRVTSIYRAAFDRIGVPVKENLGSFLVTEDAVAAPGTSLHVGHFLVGQYITVSGKTIDWGFQGVVHRWGMKGGPALRTTKSHRRVGSIGTTGDARVLPGKRLPGHMGYEWVLTAGLQVLRINLKEQVMYVKGCVPGEVGDILLVNDCLSKKKRVIDPPFPTFLPDQMQIESLAENPNYPAVLSNDEIFAEKLHRFSSPSIVFTEEHATKSAARDKSRAKIAKAKK